MVLSSIFSDALICRFQDKTKLKLMLLTLSSWLSGYISGPKKLNESVGNKDITAYVFLTSNAGIGFTVSFVGGCLWKSTQFGAYLYVMQLLTSLLIFACIKKTPFSDVEFKKIPLFSSFTKSVKQSTIIMLEICGFTVVFSAIKGIIVNCSFLKSNEFLKNAFSSILEISEGVYASAKVSDIMLGLFLTGLSVGFGGICMCFQTFAVCDNVFQGKFILYKLLQGILCGALCVCYSFMFDIKSSNILSTSIGGDIDTFSVFVNALLLALSMLYLKKFLKSKTNQI